MTAPMHFLYAENCGSGKVRRVPYFPMSALSTSRWKFEHACLRAGRHSCRRSNFGGHSGRQAAAFWREQTKEMHMIRTTVSRYKLKK